MKRKFTHCFHVPGALTADLNIRFTVPSDCQLVHVSAVGSNANDATFTIGDSTDTDEFLTSSVFGDSNTPAEYDGDDFVDTSGNTHGRYYPRIADGTIVVIPVTYGDVLGTAINDPTLVLTFVEG